MQHFLLLVLVSLAGIPLFFYIQHIWNIIFWTYLTLNKKSETIRASKQTKYPTLSIELLKEKYELTTRYKISCSLEW